MDSEVEEGVGTSWGGGSNSDGGGGCGGDVVYFTGDSFSRKSRRLGSRSRRGLLLVLSSLSLPQIQPIGVNVQLKGGPRIY